MSNGLYVIAGIACLSLGLFVTVFQVKKFIRKKQDNLGFDIKLLAGGIMFIIIGIALIIHHL
jgi:hypothetical protein